MDEDWVHLQLGMRLQLGILQSHWITLLGMEIDNSFKTFNPHIGNLCKKAASQLIVLKRLLRFLGYNERRIIMQSFILSNFNYCAPIWHFCSESNTAKIEKNT